MDDENFESQKLKNDAVYDFVRDRKVVKDPKVLTKSKFLNGLQCPKLLWMRCNAPEAIPLPSDRLQQVFDVGHKVGELAMTRFPGGARIQEDDFLRNIEETKTLLAAANPKPIYEAGVMAGRLFSRADILVPSSLGIGYWDIVEVKCGTDLKDVYLQDIAFQRYCYELAGLKIGRCFLMHINSDYVRDGDIDVQEFFALVDVTDKFALMSGEIKKTIDGFLAIVDMPTCPGISIGKHCNKPYECQMKLSCWAFLPPGNVLELRGNKDKAFQMLDQGIVLLKDIPKNAKLSDTRAIQYQCALAGKPHVDLPAIVAFVKGMKYPLYFIDFETIFEAIPRFNGTSPYQQIPIQFSVHVQEIPGGELKHYSFLQKSPADPRKDFLDSLCACTGIQGNVVVYNRTFEESHVLNKMKDSFPEYESRIADICSRMADLLDVFRSFLYYHPDQRGSASIKKVLPVLGGKSYKDMAISDGGQATTEYSRVTYGDQVDPADRQKVYTDLEDYCALDTIAMVDILAALEALQKG